MNNMAVNKWLFILVMSILNYVVSNDPNVTKSVTTVLVMNDRWVDEFETTNSTFNRRLKELQEQMDTHARQHRADMAKKGHGIVLPGGFELDMVGQKPYLCYTQMHRNIQRAEEEKGSGSINMVSHLDDLMGSKSNTARTFPPSTTSFYSPYSTLCSHLCLLSSVSVCPVRVGGIFCCDMELKNFSRAFLNGSFLEVVVEIGLDYSRGLAGDCLASSLYLVDAVIGEVAMSVVWRELETPQCLVVNMKKEKIIWSSWGLEAVVERAVMDGSMSKGIGKRIRRSTGLSAHMSSSYLNWIDQNRIAISFTSLLALLSKIISTGLVYSLTHFSSMLYLINWKAHAVYSSTLPAMGSSIPTMLHVDIVMVKPIPTPLPPTSCLNHLCSSLCLPQCSTPVCGCPSHYSLLPDITRLGMEIVPLELVMMGDTLFRARFIANHHIRHMLYVSMVGEFSGDKRRASLEMAELGNSGGPCYRNAISSIYLYSFSTTEVSQFVRGTCSTHLYTGGEHSYLAGQNSSLAGQNSSQAGPLSSLAGDQPIPACQHLYLAGYHWNCSSHPHTAGQNSNPTGPLTYPASQNPYLAGQHLYLAGNHWKCSSQPYTAGDHCYLAGQNSSPTGPLTYPVSQNPCLACQHLYLAGNHWNCSSNPHNDQS